MTPSTPPTPPASHVGCDSLAVDTVIAYDDGSTIVLPADPEAFAEFVAERRKLEARRAPKTKESEK